MTSIAEQLVDRALADRHDAYASEVQQLIDAAFAVIAATGHLDPPVRAILAEAGLSNPTFYRHFRSKDELLLVMLDEGRRRLVDYLAHRVDTVSGTTRSASDERVAEWVRGVLAQARDTDAAQRTRPFVVEVERLHARFPEQQAASEQQIVAHLAEVLGARGAWAETVYALVFAELARHLRADRQPSDGDVDAVVRFVLSGIGADPD